MTGAADREQRLSAVLVDCLEALDAGHEPDRGELLASGADGDRDAREVVREHLTCRGIDARAEDVPVAVPEIVPDDEIVRAVPRRRCEQCTLRHWKIARERGTRYVDFSIDPCSYAAERRAALPAEIRRRENRSIARGRGSLH